MTLDVLHPTPYGTLTPSPVSPLLRNAPSSLEFKKCRKRLNRLTRQAITDFAMLGGATRWLVCLSGGKDSWAMLGILLDLQAQEQLPVDLIACNLDQGQPGFHQRQFRIF